MAFIYSMSDLSREIKAKKISEMSEKEVHEFIRNRDLKYVLNYIFGGGGVKYMNSIKENYKYNWVLAVKGHFPNTSRVVLVYRSNGEYELARYYVDDLEFRDSHHGYALDNVVLWTDILSPLDSVKNTYPNNL